MGESKGVYADIEWKLAGAWGVSFDFAWANIVETYYAIVKAAEEGKNYKAINCFQDCIGNQLTRVYAVASDDGIAISNGEDIATFPESIIFWFGDKPLVIKSSIEFIIDPVYASEKKDR